MYVMDDPLPHASSLEATCEPAEYKSKYVSPVYELHIEKVYEQPAVSVTEHVAYRFCALLLFDNEYDGHV